MENKWTPIVIVGVVIAIFWWLASGDGEPVRVDPNYDQEEDYWEDQYYQNVVRPG